jgi:hypothetical protein
VLDELEENECIRVQAGPASRFAQPGLDCTEVEAKGARCALFRRGEPQAVRWNDWMVDGETLDSMIVSGAACTCGG